MTEKAVYCVQIVSALLQSLMGGDPWLCKNSSVSCIKVMEALSSRVSQACVASWAVDVSESERGLNWKSEIMLFG